jgi:hypothetical protein
MFAPKSRTSPSAVNPWPYHPFGGEPVAAEHGLVDGEPIAGKRIPSGVAERPAVAGEHSGDAGADEPHLPFGGEPVAAEHALVDGEPIAVERDPARVAERPAVAGELAADLGGEKSHLPLRGEPGGQIDRAAAAHARGVQAGDTAARELHREGVGVLQHHLLGEDTLAQHQAAGQRRAVKIQFPSDPGAGQPHPSPHC